MEIAALVLNAISLVVSIVVFVKVRKLYKQLNKRR